jgi:hypothetical protein
MKSMKDGPPGILSRPRINRVNITRTWYWSLASTVILFLVLLQVVKVQDIVARALGYVGAVPMFALDQMTHGYTPAQVREVLMAYGENGRRAYTFLLLTLDLVFPFFYGSFLFFSIRGAAQRAGISPVWGAWLAASGYGATCFDWLENASFLFLMKIYPRESITVAKAASFFTVTKFLWVDLSAIVLTILGVLILWKSPRVRAFTKSF